MTLAIAMLFILLASLGVATLMTFIAIALGWIPGVTIRRKRNTDVKGEKS